MLRQPVRTAPAKAAASWLLWLALLLPLAQLAGSEHGLLHLDRAAADETHRDQGLAQGCDLCLLATAAAHGAGDLRRAPLPLVAAAKSQPFAPHRPGAVAPAPAPYHSRAPPLVPEA